jgi:hypothetical protein
MPGEMDESWRGGVGARDPDGHPARRIEPA